MYVDLVGLGNYSCRKSINNEGKAVLLVEVTFLINFRSLGSILIGVTISTCNISPPGFISPENVFRLVTSHQEELFVLPNYIFLLLMGSVSIHTMLSVPIQNNYICACVLREAQQER